MPVQAYSQAPGDRTRPSILTNMAFWQSPEWMDHADSIYALNPAAGDPPPLSWWREAWELFRRRQRYDVILTMGVRTSFAFALLNRLARTPSCHIMTEVFIDDAANPGAGWRLKTACYRLLARNVDGVITNSSAEIETNARRYCIPREKFRFVPLNATIANPCFDPRPDGYLFCAGRTLRDYPTLATIIQGTDLPWHVVAGQGDLEGVSLPERVTVHREIARGDYLDLLRGARIVVLPLLSTERATGQVVMLEAMAYGKPVITSRAPGTIDTLKDGENGYLVDCGDAAGALAVLGRLLQDPGECERIGRNALETIMTAHTASRHAQLRLKALQELWEAAQIRP